MKQEGLDDAEDDDDEDTDRWIRKTSSRIRPAPLATDDVKFEVKRGKVAFDSLHIQGW